MDENEHNNRRQQQPFQRFVAVANRWLENHDMAEDANASPSVSAILGGENLRPEALNEQSMQKETAILWPWEWHPQLHLPIKHNVFDRRPSSRGGHVG